MATGNKRDRNPSDKATNNNSEDAAPKKAPPKKAQLAQLQQDLEAMAAERDAYRARLAEADARKKKTLKDAARDAKKSSIVKPKGSAGKGFSLQSAMKLDDKKGRYASIRRTVRALVDKAGLDAAVDFRRQPAERLGRIYKIAREKQPYLARFANDWATAEYIKMLLRNRREYAKRRGRAGGEDEEMDEDESDEEEEEDLQEEEEEEEEEDLGDDEGPAGGAGAMIAA